MIIYTHLFMLKIKTLTKYLGVCVRAHAALVATHDRITPWRVWCVQQLAAPVFHVFAVWFEQHDGVLIASHHAKFLVFFLSR